MAMASTESAMSSRDPREYFIPSCPMAIPSQIPMVANSRGVPPAILIPSLTAWATRCRWIWPGMTSLAVLATPIRGLSNSSSVYPMALKRERCGARSNPFFMTSERIAASSSNPFLFFLDQFVIDAVHQCLPRGLNNVRRQPYRPPPGLSVPRLYEHPGNGPSPLLGGEDPDLVIEEL